LYSNGHVLIQIQGVFPCIHFGVFLDLFKIVNLNNNDIIFDIIKIFRIYACLTKYKSQHIIWAIWQLVITFKISQSDLDIYSYEIEKYHKYVCIQPHEQFLNYLMAVTITGDRAANLDLICLYTKHSWLYKQ
jgi:hypothetical protein